MANSARKPKCVRLRVPLYLAVRGIKGSKPTKPDIIWRHSRSRLHKHLPGRGLAWGVPPEQASSGYNPGQNSHPAPFSIKASWNPCLTVNWSSRNKLIERSWLGTWCVMDVCTEPFNSRDFTASIVFMLWFGFQLYHSRQWWQTLTVFEWKYQSLMVRRTADCFWHTIVNGSCKHSNISSCFQS